MRRDIARRSLAEPERKAAPEHERPWLRRFRRSLAALLKGGRPTDRETEALAADLEEESGRLGALRQRTSAPRCLRCGAVDIMRMPAGAERAAAGGIESSPSSDVEFPHPGCGGRLLREEAEGRLPRMPPHRLYSTEGRFLHEERRL